MRGVDAHGKAREALDDRHVREVDEVAVRVAEVRLDAPEAEDDLRLTLAREVFGGVQRFVQRDAEAALHEDGKLRLPAHGLQELEVLDVARADLKHDAGGLSRLLEALGDLVHVALVRHLHRDDADAVFSREREDVRQAAPAVPLKRVGARARLVGAHPRRREGEALEGAEHGLDVVVRVDGAETRENVQVVLRELHAVVREAARAPVVLVAPEDTVFLGDAHDALDAGQDADVLDREAMRVADEVDLGHRLLGALHAMDPHLDPGQAAERVQEVAFGGRVLGEGRVEKDDHSVIPRPWGRRSTRPFFVVRAG